MSELKKVRIKSRHPSHSPLRGALTVKECNLPFNNRLNSKGRPSVAVRFGSPTEVSKNTVEINSIDSIRTSSNKIKMKEAFEDFNIKTPKFFHFNDIKEFIKEKRVDEIRFPIILKRIVGSRGRGMKYIENKKELKKAIKKLKSKKPKKLKKQYYFEEFYSGLLEYRLHVSNLGCFYTCRKALKKDTPENKRYFRNDSNSVWLLENNSEFKKPSTWNAIVEECIKAKNAVGLDFAAIDVRVNKKGDFRIIETNSAPSLAEQGINHYKKHLPKLIKHKYDNNYIN